MTLIDAITKANETMPQGHTKALKEAMGVLGCFIGGWADRGLYYKLGRTGITLKLKRKRVEIETRSWYRKESTLITVGVEIEKDEYNLKEKTLEEILDFNKKKIISYKEESEREYNENINSFLKLLDKEGIIVIDFVSLHKKYNALPSMVRGEIEKRGECHGRK